MRKSVIAKRKTSANRVPATVANSSAEEARRDEEGNGRGSSLLVSPVRDYGPSPRHLEDSPTAKRKRSSSHGSLVKARKSLITDLIDEDDQENLTTHRILSESDSTGQFAITKEFVSSVASLNSQQVVKSNARRPGPKSKTQNVRGSESASEARLSTAKGGLSSTSQTPTTSNKRTGSATSGQSAREKISEPRVTTTAAIVDQPLTPRASTLDNIFKKPGPASKTKRPSKGPVSKRNQHFVEKTLETFGFMFKLDEAVPFANRTSRQPPEIFNVLTVDQAVFMSKFEEEMNSNPDLFEKFTDTMAHYFDHLKEEEIEMLCIQTESSRGCNSARGNRQDSLVLLLLNCSITQRKLLDSMSQHMSLYISRAGTQTEEGVHYMAMFSLLLSQIRMVEHFEDPLGFVDQVVSLLGLAGTENKKEILMALPHMIVSLDALTEELREQFMMFLEEPEIRPTALYVLSYLNPSDSDFVVIIERVMELMKLVELKELPEIVKFLFEVSRSAEDCKAKFKAVRDKINANIKTRPFDFAARATKTLHSTPARGRASTKGKGRKKSGPERDIPMENAETMLRIVDMLIMASRNNVEKGMVINAVIENLGSTGPMMPFDVFLTFFFLAKLPMSKEKIEKEIVMPRIKNHSLDDVAVNSFFAVYGKFFDKNKMNVLNEVLDLAKRTMKSYGGEHGFSAAIYQNLFTNITDEAVSKQIGFSVIIAISQHVSSLNQIEVRYGVEVLVDLCRCFPEKVNIFSPSLKTLLEQSRQMPPKQVMDLYHCFACILTVNETLTDYIEINLMKHLNTFEHFGQSVAVLGITSIAATFLCTPIDDQDLDISINAAFDHNATANPNQGNPSQIASQCGRRLTFDASSLRNIESMKEFGLKLLDVVEAKAETNPKLFALFCDTMADLMTTHKLVPEHLEKMAQKYTKIFRTNFVERLPTTSQRTQSKEYAYGIGTDSGKSFIIGLNSKNIAFLMPLFRLITTFCRRNENVMKHFQRYLSASVTIGGTTMKEIAVSNWLATNWMRETINAYSESEDQEVQSQLCQRLDFCVSAEGMVTKHMDDESDWASLPEVLFKLACKDKQKATLADDVKVCPSQKKPGRPTAAVMTKKVKGVTGLVDMQQVDEDSRDTTQNSKTSQRTEKRVDDANATHENITEDRNLILDEKLKGYAKLMRPLELSVFEILKLYRKDNERGPTLSKTAVVFLLNELQWKLATVIPKVVGRHTGRVSALSRREIRTVVSSIGLTLLDMAADMDKNETLPDYVTVVISSMKMLLELLIDQDDSLINDTINALVANESETAPEGANQFVLLLDKFDCMFNSIARVKDACFYLQLITTVEMLSGRTSDEDFKAKLVEKCWFYCKKEWPGRPDLRYFRILFDTLFRSVPEKRCVIHLLGTVAINVAYEEEEVKDIVSKPKTKKNLLAKSLTSNPFEVADVSESNMYPWICSETFPILFELLLKYLIEVCKESEDAEKLDGESSKLDSLSEWYQSIVVFYSLLKVTVHGTSKSFRKNCLRFGKTFVELFMKRAMSLVRYLFEPKKDLCIDFLESMQKCAKLLHQICNSCKVDGEGASMNYIPQVKKTLDELLYSVKTCLEFNGLGSAMIIRNMKAKNIGGDDLPGNQISQISSGLSSSKSLGDSEGCSSEDDDMYLADSQQQGVRKKKRVTVDEVFSQSNDDSDREEDRDPGTSYCRTKLNKLSNKPVAEKSGLKKKSTQIRMASGTVDDEDEGSRNSSPAYNDVFSNLDDFDSD